MAFLGKAKKQDLVLLAEELGQKVSDKMTIIELRNIIIGSKDYEEEFVRALLSVILEERLKGKVQDEPRDLQAKFMKHQRIPARSWRDFVFEITSYFEEWLDGMEVRNFKSLKDLIITDQLKKRVQGEIREHFVDECAKFYEPSVLADKLDGYESVRSSVKKTSQPEMSLSNTSDSRSNIKKEHAIIKNVIQSQRYKLPFKQEPKQPTFKPTCYSCGRVGHTSRVCHAKIIRKPPLLARSMLWRPMNVFKNNPLQF
ncbi:CCHC-type domain-containing protein [Trichonephila clavipes]|nr:CCHC-type domain-containing protein [Trichonephila clavipes]